jgi:hypothetical protein
MNSSSPFTRSLLARTHATTALSEGTRADDHGGLRPLEWRAGAALEGRTTKAAQRPPLSAGHIEVKQD